MKGSSEVTTALWGCSKRRRGGTDNGRRLGLKDTCRPLAWMPLEAFADGILHKANRRCELIGCCGRSYLLGSNVVQRQAFMGIPPSQMPFGHAQASIHLPARPALPVSAPMLPQDGTDLDLRCLPFLLRH
jgi:hypothetical protein